MRYFSLLERTIEAALAGNPVGRAVFVRAHLELTADHGLLIPISEAGLAIARRWVGASVRRIHALGGVRHGSVSLQVEFAEGQTSLVSAELTHGGEPVVHLLIAGQQGTLRFDDFPDPRLLVQAIGVSTPGYRGVIERSLTTGKPMLAAEER
ncbi:MAG: hypothetical protein EXQ52_06550 [Bryobacterales bacterium]|nr:hypothetical protein [Bryobacterales bacterium]